MKTLGQIAGVLLAIGVVLLIIPLFLFMIGVVLCFVVIAFATGIPVHVRKDGEVIGKIVYFKYYPKGKDNE